MVNEDSERLRRRLLNPWIFRAYLLRRLPLAAGAGLRLSCLDEERCTVVLPGGWRTQNPFHSTYFAAQTMAAEMSTGVPAMVLVAGVPASVALLVRELRAVFTRKIVGESLFTFSDVQAMRAAVDRAAATDEPQTFLARSRGTVDGEAASEFEVTWSFKRRS
jgi:hypothetical protein